MFETLSALDLKQRAQNDQCMFFGYSFNLDRSHCKFIINLLLFLAKFYIHKCTFSKKTPYFFIFRKDLDVYVNSLRNSNNSIACKTICKSYKLI